MRYRSKINPKKSKKLFKATNRPVTMNRKRPGLRRGGIRL